MREVYEYTALMKSALDVTTSKSSWNKDNSEKNFYKNKKGKVIIFGSFSREILAMSAFFFFFHWKKEEENTYPEKSPGAV